MKNICYVLKLSPKLGPFLRGFLGHLQGREKSQHREGRCEPLSVFSVVQSKTSMTPRNVCFCLGLDSFSRVIIVFVCTRTLNRGGVYVQNSQSKLAVEQTSQADLQGEALRYLKEYGPLNWNALYVRFNADRNGDIGPALQSLQEQNYIEVGSDNIARLTACGMAQLQRGDEMDLPGSLTVHSPT
jgi:hypothetical protein